MKPLLLFVGNNPSTTDLLNHLFTARYRTVTCATAHEALAYLESASEAERPAVVLCDQASGDDTTPIEVFRGLKNHHQNESLPAVVLCAVGQTADGPNPLCDLGWADHIGKPFNPEDLTLRIRQLLVLHH